MLHDNNSDHSEDDYDFNGYAWDYPGGVGSPDSAACSSSNEVADPESFDYECLKITEVESVLNEAVASLTDQIQVKPSLAKLLLHQNAWCAVDIVDRFKADCESFLIASKLKPKAVNHERPHLAESKDHWLCEVCANAKKPRDFYNLCCGHCFCLQCWKSHVESQIKQNQSVGIECMDSSCGIVLPEDFIMDILTNPEYRAKYQQLAFEAHVLSSPQLQFCPGVNCNSVIRAKQSAAKKVTCKSCSSNFCFKCTLDYHAPASCDVIKLWLIKCLDDSETANYITANTKDCPKCHICIEKNGGCNHMQCWKCKHHFCWMCMGDWKTHGSEYYECSRYKENPNIVNEAVHVKAREALQKYLFYYERWENHIKSLDLEEAMFKKIQERIDDKISKKEGTWIDWLYLNDAAALLTKCRYTLQYTYPYAYYIENGPRKQLFEYQQGQLEAEIENLSWKVERAGSTDRGDLENQMHIAEQKRRTLLKDFS